MSGAIKIIKKWTRKQCSFNWEIADFETLFLQDNKHSRNYVPSPVFNYGEDLGVKSSWLTFLTKINGNLICIVKHMNSQERENKFKINVSLGSLQNPRIYNKTWGQAVYNEGRFSGEIDGWVINPLIKISYLRDQESILLEGNTLRVCVDIEMVDYSIPNLTPTISLTPYQDHQPNSKFSIDFEKLLDSKKLCDVTIRCQDKVFPCHKVILSARSKVFEVMFDCNMMEAIKGEILIDEMEPTTVEAILHYIYTGKMNDLPGSCPWIDLLDGAEKYCLDELKKYCFENFMKTLNEKNAGEVALVAYKYNVDPDIQIAIREYCHCHIQSLLEDPSFRKIFFQNPKAFYDYA